MAKSRTKPARSGARGWIVAVLILSLLIIAGFGVGLLAGVIWEEPQLAYSYIAGETESVAWNRPSSSAVPDVAAPATPEPPARKAPEAIADPQARREQVAVPAPAATVPAKPVGEFSVQVGAFASSQAADGLASDLRAKGFDVYVSPGTKAGESRWRVRVGPVATRSDAEDTANRLKQVEKLPTWIQKEDAS